jgi:NAD(P)-dependent dehydrogenase (short-subunit alcohol dehydrogenase family)
MHDTAPATSSSDPILITGCSSGIGRATAERLVRAGRTVYATARRPETIADLREAGAHTLALDVTDEESMRAAVAAVEADHGPVLALVNNAGYSQSGAVESVSLELVRRQFETNVFGALRLAQLVLPGMRRAGRGRIVNVSSMGGRLVFPGGGVYHATKYALEALSDAMRFELRGFGVAVVLIEPGLIRTRFGEAAVGALQEAGSDAGDHAGNGAAYAEFNAAVAQATKKVYESGPLSRLGAGPEAVAKTIEKAIAARRPRPRYPVTISARLLLAQRALVPDRMWDAMMRSQFPQPR